MKSCLILVRFPTSLFLQTWRVAPREGLACQAYTPVSPLTDGLSSHAQWTTLETWFTGKVNSVIQADSPQLYCGIVQLCYPLQNTKASLARQLSWPNTMSLLKLAVQSLPFQAMKVLLPQTSTTMGTWLTPNGNCNSINIFLQNSFFSKSRTLNQVTMGKSAMQRRQGSHAVGNEMAGKG